MRDDIKINDRATAIQDKLVEKLERIYDPDVELDVYNLGLIYEINLDENGHCKIVMTFTGLKRCRAPNKLLDIKIPMKIFDLALTIGKSQARVTSSSVPPWRIQKGMIATTKTKDCKLTWPSFKLPVPVTKRKTTTIEN